MKALVLVCVGAVTVALAISESRPAHAQQAAVDQTASQQSGDDARQAAGTWKTDDGSAAGRWRARYVVQGGSFTGTAVFEGAGTAAPAAIQGRADGDHVTFSTTSAADADGTKTVTWQFDGIIRGAKVKGTLVDGNGRSGTWDGWWTASERERKAREQTDAAPVAEQ